MRQHSSDPVLFTDTNRMKAQINEKSTVEIRLCTHSSLRGFSCQRLWQVLLEPAGGAKNCWKDAQLGWNAVWITTVRTRVCTKKMAMSKKKEECEKVGRGPGWLTRLPSNRLLDCNQEEDHDHFVHWIWGDNLFLPGRLAASDPRPFPPTSRLVAQKPAKTERERARLPLDCMQGES